MADTANLSLTRGVDSTLVVSVSGTWRLHHGMPLPERVAKELTAAAARRVTFEARDLGGWDSSLVNFVSGVLDFCREKGVEADQTGLPAGVRRLVRLAAEVPDRTGTAAPGRETLLERIGAATITARDAALQFLSFLGEVVIALGVFARGRARYRGTDFVAELQRCGADALGIVTLISYLVGIILAFMGAVQLSKFGAAIYVADLVGIGMIREMGAMMTAIIMAGRTGAAFAAELGTMKVTEEIDAYTTMGISPIEFLVLPRVLALVLMMPMLCLYSDFVGILGGATVSAGMLGVSLGSYYRQTIGVITAGGLLGGLFKSAVYGLLVAIAGCLRGFECGDSSSAVGDAATEAVVTGIVLIVVACGIFAVIFNILGI